MHDFAMLNTAVPQPIADRMKDLGESYRERAKDASGMAAQAARALGINGGLNASGGSVTGFTLASSLRHLSLADENATCYHCNTRDASGWRQGLNQGKRLCNACGLYFVKRWQKQPPDPWSKKRSSLSNVKNGGGNASKARRFSLHNGAPVRDRYSSKMKNHGGSSGSPPHDAVCAPPSRNGHLLMDRHAEVAGGGPDQMSKSLPDDYLAQAFHVRPVAVNLWVRAGASMQPHIPSMTGLLVPKTTRSVSEKTSFPAV
jgi:GATA zinc finger